MARDPRYDILFEPVAIGPVTTRNRFYQVPHCTGMGYKMPHADATFRGLKAEGGWGVVCCEQCSIHPTSDSTPNAEVRLWDDNDVRRMAPIADAVHEHGALAGVELAHTGIGFGNRYTREVPLAPSHQVAIYNYDPMQARAMDKSDIREFRRWQVDAARRAKMAGFDIVYVYAGENNFALPMNFLSRRRNFRTDEYGGSLENRCRLLREMLEDTKEAVGDTCAVALRIALKEFVGPMGIESEAKEIVEILAELPDLWDVNVSDWQYDSAPSRFDSEAHQEPYIDFVKSITSKPVVGVGRFTSPDTMVSQIRRGVLDLIGAARPSIADPYLPRKIEEGRIDDIRECIGCQPVRGVGEYGHAVALLPEPDRCRRVGARLAPGAHRSEGVRGSRARSWRRTCRPGVRTSIGATRLWRRTCRSTQRAGRARDERMPPARTVHLEPNSRLPCDPDRQDGERRGVSRESAHL